MHVFFLRNPDTPPALRKRAKKTIVPPPSTSMSRPSQIECTTGDEHERNVNVAVGFAEFACSTRRII